MYNIAIIGHRPEDLREDTDVIRIKVERVIDDLYWQYGSENIVFNLVGERGISEWAIKHCISQSTNIYPYKYHLYIPFMPQETSKYWFDQQKQYLETAFENAGATTISYPTYDYNENLLEESEKSAIRDANFIVAFWHGNKQGKTFNSIKYALNTNKLALNALNNLRLITNKDIIKKPIQHLQI